MEIDEACAAPAAQNLLAFIRANYGTIPAFCEAKGLDRLKVARAIKGQLVRVDVDFAFAVEEATDRAVPAESWRMDEALRAELLQRRRKNTGPEAA